MRFNIDPKTRAINNNCSVLGTEGENNIEEVEFTIPKIIGKADISAAGTKCILYYFSANMPEENSEKKVLDYSELDESTMIAKWSVGRGETQNVGLLYVAIHFATVFDNVLHTQMTTFLVNRTINVESPQPVLFSTRKARSAFSLEKSLQPEPDPINIIGNVPIIPASLRPLAVQGDNKSKLVPIKMSRMYRDEDLSQYPIYLIVTTAGGGISISLDKQLTADEITMIWTVKRPATDYAGNVTIQFRIGDKVTDTFCKFTEISSTAISKSSDYEPIVPVTPPEFEEYLRQIEAVKQQAVVAKDTAVVAKDTAVVAKDTAVTKAGEAAASAAKAKASEENSKKSETGAEGSLTDINTGLVSRLPISEANQLFKSVVIDETTGIFTFTRYDGTQLIIDTGLEKVVVNFRLDPDTLELILMLADGTEQRVSLVPFLNLYTGGSTTTVDILVSGTIITASIKGNSISFNLLTPDLQAIINNKITANSVGNANQVKFADGKTMQQKLDAGDLNGKDGIAIEQSGLFYMRVDEFGHLKVGVPDNVEPPPLSIRNGKLIYTIM